MSGDDSNRGDPFGGPGQSTLPGPGSAGSKPAPEPAPAAADPYQVQHQRLDPEQLAQLQRQQPAAHDPHAQAHGKHHDPHAHAPHYDPNAQAHGHAQHYDPNAQAHGHGHHGQHYDPNAGAHAHAAAPAADGAQAPLPVAQLGQVASGTDINTNAIVLALSRSFRANIRPEEVTVAERTKLAAANPPVTDPFLQGFLAWRKSILLVVAVLLAPITVLKIVDFSERGQIPETWESLLVLKLVVDIGFAVALWAIIPMWTQWRRQRRFLVTLWFIYFVTPFLVFLYPWRAAAQTTDPRELLSVGALVSIYAVMSLAPKAISLMPGLMRGSIAVKLLLPGSSAPGWLIALTAPLYAIFFYVVLVLPYQMSGSGFFVGAMIGFTGAQVWMVRTGIHLARPEMHAEAAAIVKRVRVGFHVFNGFGALMLVIAFFDFAEALELSTVSVVEVFASFIANVLLLTAIATDLLISNLHRAHEIGNDATTHQAQVAYREAIAHFAPPVASAPPPPAQQQHGHHQQHG